MQYTTISIYNAIWSPAEPSIKLAPGHSQIGVKSWPPSLGLLRLIWFTWVNVMWWMAPTGGI
jgi:hypothetical protein